MSKLIFEVDLYNEMTGHSMNFEYEIDEYDMTLEELKDYAEDLETGKEPYLYDEVLGNLSVIPRLIAIEHDGEEED